jgi:hypothetical protein
VYLSLTTLLWSGKISKILEENFDDMKTKTSKDLRLKIMHQEQQLSF